MAIEKQGGAKSSRRCLQRAASISARGRCDLRGQLTAYTPSPWPMHWPFASYQTSNRLYLPSSQDDELVVMFRVNESPGVEVQSAAPGGAYSPLRECAARERSSLFYLGLQLVTSSSSRTGTSDQGSLWPGCTLFKKDADDGSLIAPLCLALGRREEQPCRQPDLRFQSSEMGGNRTNFFKV